VRTRDVPKRGRLKVSQVVGDVRRMHQDPKNAGALFQVASQFNLLEMIGPSVTPEDGVTRYQNDPTQGPACAIAAGAATIYRNYFAPVGNDFGQKAERQIDTLADMGDQLAADLRIKSHGLWTMRNGYALPTEMSLGTITKYLRTLNEAARDNLRKLLRIGVHWDIEATEASGAKKQIISQAFCSAMPVSYSRLSNNLWDPLGPLILDAAYEATMRAAVLSLHRGGSNVIYLTLLGGGAFGNPADWILAAIRRALALVRDAGLDVRLVSYRQPSIEIDKLVGEYM
jgi:hypothetical protein